MPTQLGSASPIVLDGLVNGQEYPGAQVRARNAVGWGPWSPLSVPFMPTGSSVTLTAAAHGLGGATATVRVRPNLAVTLAGRGAATANLGSSSSITAVTVLDEGISLQTISSTPTVLATGVTVNTISPSPFGVYDEGVLIATIATSGPVQPALQGTLAGHGGATATITTTALTATVHVAGGGTSVETFIVAPIIADEGVTVQTLTALPASVSDEGVFVNEMGT